MVKLPPADWTRRSDLAGLVAALGSGQTRYVGGAVRDTLLGQDVSDVDIATPLLPADVMVRLDAAGIRNVPTGIEHGTVTAVLPGGPVEITTLRRDVSTDGRHATVAFATDWREDAARRDFTINALYADPASGEVFDWFDGLADLERGCVRFIGDPAERIREDYLRILRYFRFKARFGSQVTDITSEQACTQLAATLKGLSRERIGMEMMKLLVLPDPAPTVVRMTELGVLGVILPEAVPDGLEALVRAERGADIAPDALRRLASLLPPEPAIAEQVAARFRLSGAQRKRLATAAGRGNGDTDGRALAYRFGRSGALDRLLLTEGDIEPLKNWQIPVFPIKGGEIVERGIDAGPEIARILKTVENRWIDEGFPSRGRVLALLDAELAGGS